MARFHISNATGIDRKQNLERVRCQLVSWPCRKCQKYFVTHVRVRALILSWSLGTPGDLVGIIRFFGNVFLWKEFNILLPVYFSSSYFRIDRIKRSSPDLGVRRWNSDFNN
ncbi:hypothetical protein J6590_061055 [Homalodisca vitripennis]|nr:hypothetical protein J6590_061055 [Homalodisca vitripennis]